MSIAVIGGGAFGTALAAVFARGGEDVLLWARSEETVSQINTDRENKARLKGVKLPENLRASADPSQLSSAQIALLVLPAQETRQWLAKNHDHLPNASIVCCAKGIDQETQKFQSELASLHFPNERIAVLSGPGFATEIAAGCPTALTIAAHDPALSEKLQRKLSTDALRLYHSGDVLGVEIGGAMKNIVAIGCGVALGAGLGQSARAALLTRGFSEMVKLGLKLGAKAETIGGLAGLGDLTLTATSETSRNYALGLALGAGQAPDGNKTTEGAYTARVALSLARAHDLDLPVTETTSRLIEGEINVKEAVEYLFSRPLGKEF